MHSRKLAASALGAALAVTVVAPATTASSAGADERSSTAASASATKAREKRYERKVRVYTNKARARHDRKRLKKNKCVDKFANTWARKMARRQELEHQSLGPIARKCNLRMVGENIAYGYPSAKAVVRGWMKSPGHRANILRRGYRLLGVGMARDKNGRPWASQVFGRR